MLMLLMLMVMVARRRCRNWVVHMLLWMLLLLLLLLLLLRWWWLMHFNRSWPRRCCARKGIIYFLFDFFAFPRLPFLSSDFLAGQFVGGVVPPPLLTLTTAGIEVAAAAAAAAARRCWSNSITSLCLALKCSVRWQRFPLKPHNWHSRVRPKCWISSPSSIGNK